MNTYDVWHQNFKDGLLILQNKTFVFSQAVYFSFATFTTMGFDDIQPKLDSFLHYVVSAKAFVDLFIITLFVGIYTRKIIR